jgi:hypothetical protein
MGVSLGSVSRKCSLCGLFPGYITRTPAESLTRRGGPKAPTAIHSPSGPIFYPIDKANVIANYLENQFTPHELCDLDHERRVRAKVQAVRNTVDEAPPPQEKSGQVTFQKKFDL